MMFTFGLATGAGIFLIAMFISGIVMGKKSDEQEGKL